MCRNNNFSILVGGINLDVRFKTIGSVIADDQSPSFDIFRFKVLPNEYVFPGMLVGAFIDEDRFLIGRISSSLEINPYESASKTAVRHVMGLVSDYPEEGLSTTIYRIYEAEIIEEGIIDENDIIITEPSNMARAGKEVFLPHENVIAKAMGFEQDPGKFLCIGRTRITALSNAEDTNNVLLKPQIIQRHIFIGGTTGSGKSFSTGIILEEINRFKIPIVILDSQREYIGLTKGLGGAVLIPGEDYSVMISSLAESELLNLVPTLKGTQGYELLAYSFIRLKRERIHFNLDDLLEAMENDAPALEIKASSLRLALARTSSSIGRHNFLGEKTDWKSLLLKYPVINIDCANLDQSQLQLIVGATLRELTTRRIKKEVPPYVVVLDEAHLLVPEGEDSSCKQVIRENVRIGRHYGICVILITQSPVDIDKKTIRQCNTRFIFALEPDQLDSLRGVKSDATDDMLNRLPKMPVGTCLLSGTYETIKHAIPIQIRSNRKTPVGGKTPDIFEEMKSKWTEK